MCDVMYVTSHNIFTTCAIFFCMPPWLLLPDHYIHLSVTRMHRLLTLRCDEADIAGLSSAVAGPSSGGQDEPVRHDVSEEFSAAEPSATDGCMTESAVEDDVLGSNRGMLSKVQVLLALSQNLFLRTGSKL